MNGGVRMRRAAALAVWATLAATGCGKQTEGGKPASAQAVPIDIIAQAQALPGIPAKPHPDHSKSLDFYTLIKSPRDLDIIAIAFSILPVTDDQKFQITPEASSAHDAFAKHELMPKVIPAIDAQVATAEAQRYYRLNLDPAQSRYQGYNVEVKDMSWGGWSPMADAYDFEKKGFPVECPTATVQTNRTRHDNYFERVNFESVQAAAPPTAFHGPYCLLSVDEAAARAIEAIRARTGKITYGRASLYFFVVDAMPGGWPSEVHAVLTHFDGAVVDPAHETTELAHVSMDFSQPQQGP